MCALGLCGSSAPLMWIFNRNNARLPAAPKTMGSTMVPSAGALGAQQAAATVIQRWQRGHITRQSYASHRHAVRCIQRWARGLLARCKARAQAVLASPATSVQRHWRSQRKEMAVLQMQLAARAMLAQRQADIEGEVRASISSTARWHHHRSAAVLQTTLQGEDKELARRQKQLSGVAPNPIQMVTQTFTGIVERASSKSSYTDLDGFPETALIEHCGWLLKMGRAVHSWKMRWVMLQVSWLRTQPEPQPDRNPSPEPHL